jgi:hypothetical protein
MTAIAWQPEQNNHGRTTGHKSQCRTELPGQENRNRMARRGQPGKDSQERTARTGQLQQPEKTARTEAPEYDRRSRTGLSGHPVMSGLTGQDRITEQPS